MRKKECLRVLEECKKDIIEILKRHDVFFYVLESGFDCFKEFQINLLKVSTEEYIEEKEKKRKIYELKLFDSID